jgi:hypothetical protein
LLYLFESVRFHGSVSVVTAGSAKNSGKDFLDED